MTERTVIEFVAPPSGPSFDGVHDGSPLERAMAAAGRASTEADDVATKIANLVVIEGKQVSDEIQDEYLRCRAAEEYAASVLDAELQAAETAQAGGVIDSPARLGATATVHHLDHRRRRT